MQRYKNKRDFVAGPTRSLSGKFLSKHVTISLMLLIACPLARRPSFFMVLTTLKVETSYFRMCLGGNRQKTNPNLV